MIFGIALIPKNLAISQYFESNIYPYLVLGIVFFLGFGILIFANLLKRKTKTSPNIASESNGKEIYNETSS